MKKGLSMLVVCLLSLMALGHEFWLSPQKFFFSIRDIANIRFLVGEDFKGSNWNGSRDKIMHLLHYNPSGGIIDIASSISSHQGDSLQLSLREEGTHMVVFNSTNTFIKLDADKFNAYLKEAGLDHINNYRKQHEQEQADGSEYYQRSVKTILQVGTKVTDDCLRPSILPLDIIPEENPYAVPTGTNSTNPVKLRFQVLFNGQPLNNALVRTWYRVSGNIIRSDSSRTNRRGWVIIERHPGPNMLSCVHMERNDRDNEAQWQSYWGSLSFEYSQFFPGKTGR